MSVLIWELKLNVFSTEISERVSAGGVCWSTRESVCVCVCVCVCVSVQTAYLPATGPLSFRVHHLSSRTLQVWLYKVLSESMCGIWTYWRAHKLTNAVLFLLTPLPAGENDIIVCRLDKISQQLDDNHSCMQAFPGSVSTMMKSCTFPLPNTFFLQEQYCNSTPEFTQD